MARPKLGDSETERLHLKITADEISAIDEWRYENRVPSRSEAVRRLVQMGLQADHSFNHVKAQTDGTFEFIADRIQTHVVRKKAESEGGARPGTSVRDFADMLIDTLTMVGNLAGTVSAAARKVEIMKRGGEVTELIQQSKHFETVTNKTAERVSKMFSKLETDE
ncbi:hypothetical protein [Aquamicrobium soli]|uniref:Ribbon-helix-helix protein CopG domain-containing protein n=1 Tax=Aquamicrobium soli TaxID=1811518 RepID=A0ABV7KEG0_9HYPH